MGMAKGICELAPASRGAGEVCDGPRSAPIRELPEGIAEVGEGMTSDKRDRGSFRSVFQMPGPQPKEEPDPV